jgi:two-component system, OmpR family, sensor histidine kinase BaeS
MNQRLIFKLLAIHLVVIAFTMAIMWLVIDTLAAGYFVTLMEKYHISPAPAHAMFVNAIHRYLIWACLAALILAVVLSFLMLRRLLTPLTRMTHITQEIAAGNFSAQVPAGRQDEIGRLAQAFNRMAESLKKLESLRRSLMIDVAHELRTPLTNIRGYLEALNDGVLPPSTKTFSLLQSETMRLVELVEDVLRLARADAAQISLKFEKIDVCQAIRKAIEPFTYKFGQKELNVELQLPADGAVIPADPNRIARVLRSLADNVARYTPHKGKVKISVTSNIDHVRIDFINSVQELVSEDLPYLFERFYRGEKSRSRQHGGAGIGLAIVKEMVEAHGGTVGAQIEDGDVRIWLTLSKEQSR